MIMKNYLKVDVANSRLVMDRTFAKNCAIAGSAEYNLLQSARKDYPNFTVEQRTIKRNANKECYRGLTYDYMKKYISSHESEKTVDSVMAELEEMILISKCHSMGYRYPSLAPGDGFSIHLDCEAIRPAAIVQLEYPSITSVCHFNSS